MTGLPKNNYPAFFKAQKNLEKAGYKVINPARLNKAGELWTVCLRNDLIHILKYCKGVAVLRNWRHSKGGRLEVSVAIQLGMPIIDAVTFNPLHITLEQKFMQRRIVCKKRK